MSTAGVVPALVLTLFSCLLPIPLVSLLLPNPFFFKDSDIRSSRMSSIFTVALHISRNLPSVQYKVCSPPSPHCFPPSPHCSPPTPHCSSPFQVSFYGHVMLALYLWCSNHNCTVRLYAHQLLILLWEETKGEVPDQYPMLGEVVSHIKNSRWGCSQA